MMLCCTKRPETNEYAYVYVGGPKGLRRSEFIQLIKDAKIPFEDLDIPLERWNDSSRAVFPPSSILKKSATMILHVLSDQDDAHRQACVSEAVDDLKTYNNVMIVQDVDIKEIHDAFMSHSSHFPLFGKGFDQTAIGVMARHCKTNAVKRIKRAVALR